MPASMPRTKDGSPSSPQSSRRGSCRQTVSSSADHLAARIERPEHLHPTAHDGDEAVRVVALMEQKLAAGVQLGGGVPGQLVEVGVREPAVGGDTAQDVDGNQTHAREA